MGIQKRFQNEAGVGLVEAMIAAAIIAIAAVGIFSVLDYAAQQNISATQSWASVESAMTAWSQTPVKVNVSQSVAITVSGSIGQQTESVPVAETASGNAPYGWWKAGTTQSAGSSSKHHDHSSKHHDH
jgi:Tfp pilus assembly protein PilV